MRKIVFVGFTFICLNVYSQDYYLKGNDYLNAKHFKEADSLYSISICKQETHDAFYNRAIARISLGDTCQACNDFAIMGKKYLDKEAMNYYHIFCCNKVDTVYYNKKYEISDRKNFKFYEITRWEKYTHEIYGSSHNKRMRTSLISLDFTCDKLKGFNDIKTDIIAFFTLINNQIIYTHIYNYNPTPKSETELKETNNRAKILLRNKYPELKQKNRLNEITIMFSFIITEDGTISNPNVIGTLPFISFGSREAEFKQDVIDIIKHYPSYIPAKFKGVPTKYLCKSTLVY